MARWLAPAIGGIHLQLDAILPAIIPGSDFSLEQRLLAYSVMAHAMRPILDRGLSPVLDCTYSRKAVRREVVQCLNDEDRLVVVEFAVTIEVALQRFRGRRHHGATDLTSALVVDRVQSYPYGHGSATIDSQQPIEAIHGALLRLVEEDHGLDHRQWVEAGN
jgi:predicted kinase